MEPGPSNALCPRPPLLVKVGFIGTFVGEGTFSIREGHGPGSLGSVRRWRCRGAEETEGPVTSSSTRVLIRGAAAMLPRAGLLVGGAAPGLGPAHTLSALGGGAGS